MAFELMQQVTTKRYVDGPNIDIPPMRGIIVGIPTWTKGLGVGDFYSVSIIEADRDLFGDGNTQDHIVTVNEDQIREGW